MRLTAIVLVALAPLAISLSALPVASASPGASEDKAAQTISEPTLRAHIKFLASDLLEGRGPATRGDRLAQEYIATQLEAMGFRPGAPEGGWFQKVRLTGISGKVPKTLTLAKGEKTVSLERLEDFVAFAGTQNPEARIEDAEIVFVGYGIVAPEYGWDDYKDVDVKGKVLLMMNNDPEEDPKLFAGKTRLWYGRWDYKYHIAAKKGAAGAIIIHTDPSAGYPWQVVRTSWSRERFELPYEGEPRVQIKGWFTEAASRKVAALGGQDLDILRKSALRKDFRPVPLGAQFSFAISNRVETKESANVLAKLPGNDPKLSGEAVIYTAHHDHLGLKEGGKPGEDLIHNGAVDNASGVAALLAIARAFSELPRPPRRTIYFAAVAAEEQGLLGSEYLAKHPPVPAGRIAANINIDGLNIWGRTKDLVMVGLGKSSLDETIRAVLREQRRRLVPDAFPDRGFFYRSDQFNFAKIGVPAAYFDAGVEFVGRPAGWGEEQITHWEKTHYHQPSDEYSDNWDLSGAVDDTVLAFRLGFRVANADVMPRWNAGDEFEGARQKALSVSGRP